MLIHQLIDADSPINGYGIVTAGKVTIDPHVDFLDHQFRFKNWSVQTRSDTQWLSPSLRGQSRATWPRIHYVNCVTILCTPFSMAFSSCNFLYFSFLKPWLDSQEAWNCVDMYFLQLCLTDISSIHQVLPQKLPSSRKSGFHELISFLCVIRSAPNSHNKWILSVGTYMPSLRQNGWELHWKMSKQWIVCQMAYTRQMTCKDGTSGGVQRPMNERARNSGQVMPKCGSRA